MFLPRLSELECLPEGIRGPIALELSLSSAFKQLDISVQKSLGDTALHSGATAAVAFATPTHVVMGTLGDSRLLLARDGKLVYVSPVHKADSQEESMRIRAAGGRVK
jgi:serine/threonine protein phosphatase PrpC